MMNGRAVVPVLLAGALVLTAGAAAPVRPGVQGRLLPVPAGAGATAIDVSPLGIIAGTARTADDVRTPQRWLGGLRQQLTLPAGATSGAADGLTDLGEVAGEITLDGVTRATRWSIDGRSATLIGEARSRVSAVGPYGPWGVATSDANLISGTAELVTRSGVRTPVTSESGHRRSVASIADADTALFWVTNGIGKGATARPVVLDRGATHPLPVFSSFFLSPACVTPVQADGSVVVSGWSNEAGTPAFQMIRHVGGVPGTDVVLARVDGSNQPYSGIVCTGDQVSRSLAPDGGIAGYTSEAGVQRAAYWDAANVATVVPLAPGERSAAGVLAASGRRMVIRSEGDDGSVRLSLWRDGSRTRLIVPDGWIVTSVVELTEAGLLVANVRDAAGLERPAAWQTR